MRYPENSVVDLPLAFNVNCFLSALNAVDRRALAPHLQLCRLETGQVLCDVDVNLEAVYFPVTAATSLQYLSTDGRTLGVAEIGREGVICTDIVGNGNTLPRRVVAYRGGSAYRLDRFRFAEVCDGSPTLRMRVFLHLQLVLDQSIQTAFCCRHHSVKQQICRWLLIAKERSRSIEIPVTHGILARMLGARRETVSQVTNALQKLDVIYQYRGAIVLSDLAGLEREACNCHRLVLNRAHGILSTGSDVIRSLQHPVQPS